MKNVYKYHGLIKKNILEVNFDNMFKRTNRRRKNYSSKRLVQFLCFFRQLSIYQQMN